MRKTLLTALKHGSGTIFILLAMMLGVSLQAWGVDISVTKDEVIYLDVSGHNYANNASAYFTVTVGGTTVYSNTTHNGSGVYEMIMLDNASGVMVINRHNPSGGAVWNSFTVSASRPESTNVISLSGDTNYNWYLTKEYHDGDYIYFVNGTGNKKSDGGSINDLWIYSNNDDKIGYCDIVLLDVSGDHTYRCSLYEGNAYADGAIYRVEVTEDIVCVSFKLKRGNTIGPADWNSTGAMRYSSTNVGWNTITKITGASGTSWTGNYTSYCNAPTPSTGSASSITATTVTLGATVAAAASNPCTPTYVGVNVYSDSSCETLETSGQTAFTSYAATYSIGITDLDPKTTYYYKAYAVSDAGTTEASTASSFTTACRTGVTTTDPSTSTQSVCLGGATALSVTAGGLSGTPTYTYQWYYNATASTTGAVAIPGATSSSYTPAVVGANYYYCGVAATGGYCEVASGFSGLITIKGVPVISASSSAVTNYTPVTLTASGAEISAWSITSGSGGYLYKESGTSAMFKGNVGDSGTPVTYTIQGSSNGCNGTANVTVSKNTDNCQ